MSISYKDLLKQREALEQQIQEARRRETSDAVAQVRALVADFGLTAEDIFSSGRARGASAAKGAKVAAKYRNPATGETWTGRGKAPKWIQDQDRNQFLIAA
ncbi:MAG: H-NS histone family protein [Curvibacter sp.]|nr:H-NS histone family protein [Curvibacter sp.]